MLFVLFCVLCLFDFCFVFVCLLCVLFVLCVVCFLFVLCACVCVGSALFCCFSLLCFFVFSFVWCVCVCVRVVGGQRNVILESGRWATVAGLSYGRIITLFNPIRTL